MTTAYLTEVQLRWTDLDAQGHVNNVMVADYLQQARAKFMLSGDAFEMLESLEPFIAAHLERGGRLHAFTRHLVGLFPGRRGSRLFRRHLAEHCVGAGAGLADLRAAIAHVEREAPSAIAAE